MALPKSVSLQTTRSGPLHSRRLATGSGGDYAEMRRENAGKGNYAGVFGKRRGERGPHKPPPDPAPGEVRGR